MLCFGIVFYASPSGVERLIDIDVDQRLPFDTFCIRYAIFIGVLISCFFIGTVIMAIIFSRNIVDLGKEKRALEL